MEKCSTGDPCVAAGTVARRARQCLLAILIVLTGGPSLAASEQASCQSADDAPSVHVVTLGDTLWGVASRFLRDPWCWPAVWAQNRTEVANPHRIYPGQTLRLDRARGLLIDHGNEASDPPVIRLSPVARTRMTDAEALPLIDPAWLALLQNTPLMASTDLDHAARIVGVGGDHHMAGTGDLIYVHDHHEPNRAAHEPERDVLRPLAAIIDPDTGRQLAVATRRIGQARWLRDEAGGLQVMRVTMAREELLRGDLLASASRPAAAAAIVPHAAVFQAGRVAAVLHEGRWASQQDLVVLNRGANDGLAPGSVARVGRPVRIASNETLPPVPAIDEPVATLLVFEVLDHAALAIVMRSREPFSAGAPVGSPPERAPQ